MSAFAQPKLPRFVENLFTLFVSALLTPAFFAQAQSTASPPQSALQSESNPATALSAALGAACREQAPNFSHYLTAANAAAFSKLSSDDQVALMQRFVLLDTKGRPLLSTTTDGQILLRCEAADASQGFTFSVPAIHDNLAYTPVTISSGESIRFGLVREDGNWKLLSIGLLLIDVPQLQKEWAAQSLKGNEDSALDLLRGLEQAVIRYQDAFDKLPDSLSQLGPPENGQGVSPSASGLIDSGLASGMKNGYEFRYRVVTPAGSDTPAFEIAAIPQQYGKSGKRSFLLDAHSHIHAADHHGAVATLDDPILPDQPPASSQ